MTAWSAPELPPALDCLETEAAADPPTAEGAWWITLQLVRHAWERVTSRDPRTLDASHRSLLDVLGGLPLAGDPARPLPLDELALAAEVLERPLGRILRRPNVRIERHHVLQPTYAVRETDSRSMAWLAQRPGRTVREKLGGQARALGVVRRLGVDTHENRVVRTLALTLARELDDRLAVRAAYGASEAWPDALDRLERRCGVQLDASPLANVLPAEGGGPNNALIDHPDYSKAWRVWTLLRRREDALPALWRGVVDGFQDLVAWQVRATLLARPHASTWERLVRCDGLAGEGPGAGNPIEVVMAATPGGHVAALVGRGPTRFGRIRGSEGAEVTFDARAVAPGTKFDQFREGQPVDFDLVDLGGGRTEARAVRPWRPTLTTIERRGQGLVLERHTLPTAGRRLAQSERKIEVVLGPDTDAPLIAGRGIPWAAADAGGIKWLGHADAEGLASLVAWITGRLEPAPCGTRAEPAAPVGDVLGVDVCGEAWLVCDGVTSSRLSERASVAVIDGGDDGTADDLVGRRDRRFHPADLHVSHRGMDDLVSDEADVGRASVLLDRLIDGLATRLGPRSHVGWTVPDHLDDLAQRALRSSMSARFDRALPVWRSIAAALAWTARVGGSELREGTPMIVVDAESGSLTLTLLVARGDAELLRRRPESGGKYWERRATLPDEGRGAQLTSAALLRDFAAVAVERALAGTNVEHVARARLVDHLLATNEAEALLRPEGVVVVPCGEAWLALAHDREAADAAAARWLGHFEAAVADWTDEGAPLRGELEAWQADRGTRPVVLLVGRPFTWVDDISTDGILARLVQNAVVERLDPAAGALADGAFEAAERTRLGLVAWREWLPDLILEVVKDGLYDELQLVAAGQVDAVLGRRTSHVVPQTLVLPAGIASYAFPLESGRRSHRPTGWEVRLSSPAFPLATDTPVRLTVAHRYGLADAWDLTVRPLEEVGAPFATLTATWNRSPGGAGTTGPGPIPAFPNPARSKPDVGALRRKAGQMCDDLWNLDSLTTDSAERLASALKRARRDLLALGADDEAWARAVRFPEVSGLHEVLRELGDPGDRHRGPSSREHHEIRDRALVALACLGPTCTPDLVAPLVDAIGAAVEHPLARARRPIALVEAAGYLLASGHDEALEAAIWRVAGGELHAWRAPSFHLRGVAAWTRVAWRREDFIFDFCDRHPNAPPHLFEIAERMLARLTWRVSGEPKIDPRHHGVYLHPYQTTCELLLALLRLRGKASGTGLEAGRPRVDALARTVRGLDGLLARRGCEPRSVLLRLDVDKPKALRRMSDLGWLVSTTLAGTTDLGHVHLSASED